MVIEFPLPKACKPKYILSLLLKRTKYIFELMNLPQGVNKLFHLKQM
jgi:hypothetical protein